MKIRVMLFQHVFKLILVKPQQRNTSSKALVERRANESPETPLWSEKIQNSPKTSDTTQFWQRALKGSMCQWVCLHFALLCIVPGLYFLHVFDKAPQECPLPGWLKQVWSGEWWACSVWLVILWLKVSRLHLCTSYVQGVYYVKIKYYL